MSRRTLNIRNVLQLRPAGNVNELGAIVRLDVVVNIPNNMVTLANHHVVDPKRLGVPVADLHLPTPRPTQNQLSLRELFPGLVDISYKLEELSLRVRGQLAAVGEHHAHRSQTHRIHRRDSDNTRLVVYELGDMVRVSDHHLVRTVFSEKRRL